MTKPSRSDEILNSAEQDQIYGQVRAHFDSIAPKRPVNPDRSEPDSSNGCNIPASGCDDVDYLPFKLEKLQSLQHQSSQQAVLSHQANVEEEEFVETQYYKTLVSIDKQHHTTGTGFIKVARDDDQKINTGNGVLQVSDYYKLGETMFNSNPAMNDWIPGAEDHKVGRVSTKPNRSESS